MKITSRRGRRCASLGSAQGFDCRAIQAPQIAFVHTDPAKAGELILGGSTNTVQTAHTEKTETAGLYQEMKGQGQTTQTLNQTQLHGNVHFDDSLSIEVQTATQANTASNTGNGIQTASLGAALAGAASANTPKSTQTTPAYIKPSLSQSLQALREGAGEGGTTGSGLDYMSQLQNRPGVKWTQVQLAHEQWSYDQAGLTPAGAALLTIAVAAATGGAGAELLGGTAATSTSAATLAGSTTLATMANAGFTALASQAAVSLVNNKGDIGKTLEQLGREESIKNVLTAMVTAGALDKLNASYFKGVDAKSPFTTQLQKNLTNNLASASIDAAISGKPLTQEALQASLKSALISTGTAQGANAIGDALVDGTLDTYTHKLAHAVLGCAGAAASGSQCSAGAVGAVVGELTAEYAKASGMSDDKALGLARVLAATSGVITGGGGDNAAAVNAAATAGANAAENNYLKHADAMRLAALREKQLSGKLTAADLQEIKSLIAQDKASNAALERECANPRSAACGAELDKVKLAAASYDGKPVGFDSTGTVTNEKAEAQTLAEQYSNRVNNAASYNAVAGAGKAVKGMVVGTVELVATTVAAASGDKQAQAQLSDIVKSAGDFLQNPIDNTQRAVADTLARANALEAAGQIDQAQQLRAELVTNGVLTVTGAGTVAVKATQIAVKGVDGTLAAMGRAWETGKVLNAGEITMSGGGNISAQQITRVGTPAALATEEMTQLGKLDSLSGTAAGTVRESVSNSYFERNGFTALDGKCGSNCFDGVYIKGDQVIVNEVKPLNANGSIKLTSGNEGTGLKTQMTDDWIVSRAEALKATGDPAKVQAGNQILAARYAGKLTTVISGVNSNGMVIVKVKP